LTDLITTSEAEHNLEELIIDVFGEDIERQWLISTEGNDSLSNQELHYCPRLDFAIGPFNINRSVYQDSRRILSKYQDNLNFIQSLERLDRPVKVHDDDNPRCFVAIEIERSTGTKHRMGSIINAGAIGKIGIVIGIGESAYKSLIRIRKYLELLKGVGKIQYEPKNVLILQYEEIIDVLEMFRRRNRR
jgi:hypothetical protein